MSVEEVDACLASMSGKEALLYDLIRVKDYVDSRGFLMDFGWIGYAPVL